MPNINIQKIASNLTSNLATGINKSKNFDRSRKSIENKPIQDKQIDDSQSEEKKN